MVMLGWRAMQPPRLLDRIAHMHPPVLIVGAHRSGTTATVRALSLLGLHTGQRLDSHHEPRELQRLHETYLRRSGASWYEPERFVAAVADPQRKQACVEYLRSGVTSQLSVFGYHPGLTGWLARRRLHSGAPWGWKEPRTTLFAACWLELFPGARILHVVRHPLAVAASLQRRELEFQARGDRPNGRVEEFDYCVQLAMTYVQAAEALAGRATRYHRMRFEDLQQDPVAHLRTVAAFCGIRFTGRQMKQAAATIRPPTGNPSPPVEQKRALLAHYSLAAKLGYF